MLSPSGDGALDNLDSNVPSVHNSSIRACLVVEGLFAFSARCTHNADTPYFPVCFVPYCKNRIVPRAILQFRLHVNGPLFRSRWIPDPRAQSHESSPLSPTRCPDQQARSGPSVLSWRVDPSEVDLMTEIGLEKQDWKRSWLHLGILGRNDAMLGRHSNLARNFQSVPFRSENPTHADRSLPAVQAALPGTRILVVCWSRKGGFDHHSVRL